MLLFLALVPLAGYKTIDGTNQALTGPVTANVRQWEQLLQEATQVIPAGSSVAGVFGATSPCGAAVRPLHGVAAAGPCDLLNWRLTLYEDTQTHLPTVFTLASESMYFVDNRTIRTTGKRLVTGRWSRNQERTSTRVSTVYHLQGTQQGAFLALRLIHPALLHPTGPDGTLLVGTAGASYTLSKLKEL
ncbi:hypothetical protein GCM10023091_36890 [Ravibacter arvi]|uniref:TNF family profile domain-containing protein n=2 Tax=Ravibacter arvi TaxID=2051041 RepID=A0ABP8M9M7_9BACT